MIEHQLTVRCRVRLANGSEAGVEVRADPSSTIDELTDEIKACLDERGQFRLASRVAGGLLPPDARIGDVQLRHGELVELVRGEPLDERTSALPLSGDDSYRLVSDTGPQIGLAWSVRPGGTTLLRLGSDGLVTGRRIEEDIAVLRKQVARAGGLGLASLG